MDYKEFKYLLSTGFEAIVYYELHGDYEYNISQRRDLGEFYFTIDEDHYYIFKSHEDLLATPFFDGKTLYEVWDQLDIIVI